MLSLMPATKKIFQNSSTHLKVYLWLQPVIGNLWKIYTVEMFMSRAVV